MADDFEIIIIELPKALKGYKNNPNNKVLQWMMFLDNPNDVEVVKIMKENKKIKEAKQELDKISLDEAFRRKLLNEEIYRMDLEQIKDDAHEDGLAKGEKIGIETGISVEELKRKIN